MALVATVGASGSADDGFGAQLGGQPPDVGIVMATLDRGTSSVRSFGAAFDGDSRFEIGSITKTFTGTLLADMIVRHEVAADDPIEKYLPPGANAPRFEGRSITLLDLATQTSGLPRMPTNFAPQNGEDPYDYDDAKLLAFLRGYTLTRAPGERFEYSNLGFGLLGYLLSRRLGTDYATAVRTRILAPLGMDHTSVAAFGQRDDAVPGHDADGDPVSHWHFAALAGAGGIVSTPNDMLRYARANVDTSAGPLAAAMALAQRPQRSSGELGRIGFAWLTDSDGVVWHNGGTGGFRSVLGLDVVRHRAVFAVANAALEAVDGIGFHALDAARALPAAPIPDAAVAATVLARYVGTYAFGDGSTAVVRRDDRGLVIAFDRPVFRARLHARSDSEFVIRSVGVTAQFAVPARGAATLTIVQDGQPPEVGTRKP